jgi:uncharacterized protein
MPLTLNLLELGKRVLHLKGELPASELDLDQADELIHLNQPLSYDFEAERTPDGLLLQGSLHIILDCECARCLSPFQLPIDLGNWAILLPWQGEERVTVVNDCVDLTPYLREDIVLAFPQQPLCKTECQGINELRKDWQRQAGRGEKQGLQADPWAELDKLQF